MAGLFIAKLGFAGDFLFLVSLRVLFRDYLDYFSRLKQIQIGEHCIAQ